MPGLWKHITRPIQFTLVVDDFGIKLTSSQDSEHLSSELEDLYVTTKDCEGTNVLGLTLNRYYTTKTVKMYMPKYVKSALHKLQHPNTMESQNVYQQWKNYIYGTSTQ